MLIVPLQYLLWTLLVPKVATGSVQLLTLVTIPTRFLFVLFLLNPEKKKKKKRRDLLLFYCKNANVNKK